MRIVGGSARGRRLRVPPGGTRPTSERAREALFDRLATLLELDGSRVLDLYAGTGAVGLEALSRGAALVCFVESDGRVAQVLERNIADVTAGLGTGSTSVRAGAAVPAGTTAGTAGPAGTTAGTAVRRGTVETFVAGPAPRDPFDLIFADPPYGLGDAAVAALLDAVSRPAWCVAGGVIVIERPARGAGVRWPEGVQALASKRYGEGVLWYGRPR